MKKFFSIILTVILLISFSCPNYAMASGNDFYRTFSFEGDSADYNEFIHLLLAKLVYDDLSGFEGKSVSEYVKARKELYDKEIWDKSRISYENLYSYFVGDYTIFKIFNENDKNGLYAVIFMKNRDVILSYRGSDSVYKSPIFDESNDWVNTDFRFALWNELSGQFDEVDVCIEYVKKRFGYINGLYNITFAGHSLGGALVAYSSIKTGYYGYSFDGAAGHVIDLIYSDKYLWVDDFKGVDKQCFCNYTDEKGYRIADIIQHTNAEAMYQIDRKTNVENLNENTFSPKLFNAQSHIIWSTVSYSGNTISLTEKVDAKENGFTYAPSESVSIDIAKPVSKFKDVIKALFSKDKKQGVFAIIKTMTGTVKDRKLMLAKSEGGKMSAFDFTTVIGGYTSGTILFGGAGDDYLVGYKYDDVLIAGTGDDVLDGGEGDDRYVISQNPGGKTEIIDDKGETRIMFKNMKIKNIKTLNIIGNTLILKNNQKIVLSVKNTENIKFYAYDNGDMTYLGDYGDLK